MKNLTDIKFIIAPDSFKSSISAKDFCATAESIIRQQIPGAVIESMPLADGGEGTLECMKYALDGKTETLEVTGPFFGTKVNAEIFHTSDGTAVIETAQAMGLPIAESFVRRNDALSEWKKNPLYTTTYGAGELIKKAVDDGAKKIILTLGGSSTNDCGAGLLCALGARFYDSAEKEFIPTGISLKNIAEVDFSLLEKTLRGVEFTAMCDVNNPLCGTNGCSYIYGPQKGASKEDVIFLDEGCAQFAKVIESTFADKKCMSLSEGAGAAGGLGYCTLACLNGKLKSGIQTVLDMYGFDKKLEGTSYVFTGEGCFDEQSLMGKTIGGLVSRMSGSSAKLVIFCGKNKAAGLSDSITIESINEISTGLELEYALTHADESLAKSISDWLKKIAMEK